MTTKEMIEVMQAYDRGEQIECKLRHTEEEWELNKKPFWDWRDFDYRVKPKPTYRPYKDAEEFLAAQKEHGIYIKYISHGNATYEVPIRIYKGYICTTIIGSNDILKIYTINYETLLRDYVWQDGTPCGVKEE